MTCFERRPDPPTRRVIPMSAAPTHSWGETYHAAAAMLADSGARAHVASKDRIDTWSKSAAARASRDAELANLLVELAARRADPHRRGVPKVVARIASQKKLIARGAEDIRTLERLRAIEAFFAQCGLSDRLDEGTKPRGPSQGRLDPGGATRDIVCPAFSRDPARFRERLRTSFLRGVLPEAVRTWVDDALAGVARVLLVWVREAETFDRDRRLFVAMARAAMSSGRVPVLFGHPPTKSAEEVFEAIGAKKLLQHWSYARSYGQQLLLMEHLRVRYRATQVGHKSGGLDGGMFIGMHTTQIVPHIGEVYVDRERRLVVAGAPLILPTSRFRAELRALAHVPAAVAARYDLVGKASRLAIRRHACRLCISGETHVRHLRMLRLAHAVPWLSVVDDSEIEAGQYGAGLPFR